MLKMIMYFPHKLWYKSELFEAITKKFSSFNMVIEKAIESGSLWFSLYEHVDKNCFVYMFWNRKLKLPDSVHKAIKDSNRKSNLRIINVKLIKNLKNLFVNVVKNACFKILNLIKPLNLQSKLIIEINKD